MVTVCRRHRAGPGPEPKLDPKPEPEPERELERLASRSAEPIRCLD